MLPLCSGPRSPLDWLFWYSQGIDGLFLLCMSMLVMLMQLGFSFVDVGLVQSKNVTSVLIKVCVFVYVYVLYLESHGDDNWSFNIFFVWLCIISWG